MTWFVCLWASVGGFLSGAASAAPIHNLIPNSSFEQPDPTHPDWPAGFTTGQYDRVTAESGGQPGLAWAREGHTGARSVSVTTPTEKDFGYWEVQVAVKPATRYVLSAFYKTRLPDGPPEVLVIPRAGGTFKDPGGHDFYLNPSLEWAPWRETFDTTPDQHEVWLQFALWQRAGQTVWYDDVCLIEADALPQVRLLSPAPGSILHGRRPRFRWLGPPESFLEWASDPAFRRELRRAGTEALPLQRVGTYQPAEPLSPGTWYWRVGVPDDQGQPYFLAEASFLLAGSTTRFGSGDTTPPTVNHLRPVPDTTVQEARPEITAGFTDDGDLNLSTARVRLDGRDGRIERLGE
jgi:hypothetical protein